MRSVARATRPARGSRRLAGPLTVFLGIAPRSRHGGAATYLLGGVGPFSPPSRPQRPDGALVQTRRGERGEPRGRASCRVWDRPLANPPVERTTGARDRAGARSPSTSGLTGLGAPSGRSPWTDPSEPERRLVGEWQRPRDRRQGRPPPRRAPRRFRARSPSGNPRHRDRVDHASRADAPTSPPASGGGSSARSRGRDSRRARRTWVCDPSTARSTTRTDSLLLRLAGLVEGGRPVAGVVHDPLGADTFAATAEGRATLDGRRVGRVTRAADRPRGGARRSVGPRTPGGADAPGPACHPDPPPVGRGSLLAYVATPIRRLLQTNRPLP